MRVRALSFAAVVCVAASVGLVGAGAEASGIPPTDPPDVSSIAVSRIAGIDRFDGAVRMAQAIGGPADVVYLTSGADFPDALSAGPAAVKDQGALLLVPPGGLAGAVGAELVALAPKRVVIVGGSLSVPDSVIAETRALLGALPVTRISGADRFDVSRRLAASAFPAGAMAPLVATGTRFPDALSAGPAASYLGSPIVLVDGASPTADPATLATISSLHPSWMSIAGGPMSVSAGIATSLATIAPVTRFDGPDRYAVSVAASDSIDNDKSTAYLATGVNFPDALAGGVLAGRLGHPLYLVPGTCVTREVLSSLAANGTRNVVLLGGITTLSAAVERLTPC
ncbi:cell wall-binding repeat-containing protein [Herbiconiux sp. YIM B11900]|uniref:cell wall-binding repeat-containing protein n=1 Tax=Herbiconiux sp. YIM B11900 TaxID=3404131 RepID=UPI003F8620B3